MYNSKRLKTFNTDMFQGVLEVSSKKHKFPFFCWTFIQTYSSRIGMGMEGGRTLFLKTTPSSASVQRISFSYHFATGLLQRGGVGELGSNPKQQLEAAPNRVQAIISSIWSPICPGKRPNVLGGGGGGK